MTKKKTAKDKGLLSEILKDERDKEITELQEENGQLRARAERDRDEVGASWRKLQEEREIYNSSLIALQRNHQEEIAKHLEMLKRKNDQIDSLKLRMKNYATWVGRILQLDTQIQPPEVAISQTAFVLELLRASLSGDTLEGAMQRLGYLETVFGFEAGPSKRKVFLVIQRAAGLYKNEEGMAKMLEPTSTQIYGIKALRQHLNIGLKEAKDITDQLYDGLAYKFECADLEVAQKAADELRRSGYFMTSTVEE